MISQLNFIYLKILITHLERLSSTFYVISGFSSSFFPVVVLVVLAFVSCHLHFPNVLSSLLVFCFLRSMICHSADTLLCEWMGSDTGKDSLHCNSAAWGSYLGRPWNICICTSLFGPFIFSRVGFYDTHCLGVRKAQVYTLHPIMTVLHGKRLHEKILLNLPSLFLVSHLTFALHPTRVSKTRESSV